jgi:hypothetical protein
MAMGASSSPMRSAQLNAAAAAAAYGKEHPGSGSTGYFSQMTKVYIGDVLDHLELIISSMDQFVASCDHLTDYVFVSRVELSRDSPSQHYLLLVLMLERHDIPVERSDGATEYCYCGFLA